MKKISLRQLLSAAAILLSSGALVIPFKSDQTRAPLGGFETGQLIKAKMQEGGYNNIVDQLTDHELWSTIISTDSLTEVFYAPSNFEGDIIEDEVEFDINSRDFVDAKNAVLNLVQDREGRTEGESALIYEDPEVPFVVVKIKTLESVEGLRSSSNVKKIGLGGLISESAEQRRSEGEGFAPGRNRSFLEGLGFIDNENRTPGLNFVWDWPGCGDINASEDLNLFEEDGYERIPWHYEEMGITAANECTAGASIKIALLDTGVSSDQYRLSQEGFSSSYPERTISKTTTVTGGSDDQCGHGTLMAGVIAGPKYDSAVRGIAYESNLVSIRSNKDVLLTTWFARNDLRQALKKIRKNESGTSGTKVISMSLGYLFYSPMVAFEIWRLDRRGKLMFGAIGTNPISEMQWIQVYPGKSRRVVGVTGVKKGYPSIKERCDHCHYGNKVDFVVPMQLIQENDGSDNVTHSLRMAGDLKSDVGGSSIATATMAAVAAMVWALPENVNKSDEEIFNILKNASSNPTKRHSKFGHGVVDVVKATGCYPPDPCDGVECNPGEQCVNGECQLLAGQDCYYNSDCPQGMHCDNGFCVPGSDCGPGNGNCPEGEQCINGTCYPM